MTKLQLNPILPKHIPSSKDYLKVMQASALKAIKAAKRDYESTTHTWNHKPKFVIVEQETAVDYLAATGTNDKIYGYVDDGTRAHVIRPKRSKYLRFLSGYRAKTRVGIIGSQEGGAFGDPRFATEVNHPGFPGRKFTQTIRSRRQKTLEQDISHEIAKTARTQR
jgi:hypothetical protein